MTTPTPETPAPCIACGHAPHMAGWCEHDSRPACDCNEDSDERTPPDD